MSSKNVEFLNTLLDAFPSLNHLPEKIFSASDDDVVPIEEATLDDLEAARIGLEEEAEQLMDLIEAIAQLSNMSRKAGASGADLAVAYLKVNGVRL